MARADRRAPTGLTAALLGELGRRAPLSAPELARVLGRLTRSPRGVWNTLVRLENDGLIRRVGVGESKVRRGVAVVLWELTS